ncbi:heme/hemin ABC transporter substrate-binding protein [Brevibacterium aurantiacum]|uniref:Hemin receptor n=1 Tax=Brevibacterium aurantiacum TaxID=273384 RepID=A0A2A3X9K2_BREAU|nr:ABC transporter substrate-binding protein [Brevibacterium aurantiacum]AZL07702.1 hemin receptor [Brevibacterium aurantiacum]PCC20349.1 hemin receptor [Brevibacterium aurantiacum]
MVKWKLRRVHRRRSFRRTAWIAGGCVVAVLLWNNGIHNIGSINAQGEADCLQPPARQTPSLPEVPEVDRSTLPDPTAITGPTTAYTQSGEIPPVSDTTEHEANLPVTVASADGSRQTVKKTDRILAMNQNGGIAAAVVGLGLGCKLVGRDIATDFTQLVPGAEQLPLITQGGHEINAEAVLALSPDVILTDSTIGPYDAQMQLRNAGIPVIFISSSYEEGVRSAGPQIREVANALGVPELGDKLAERTVREINGTQEAVEKLAPEDPADRPRTVFLYLRGSIYYWFGVGSGADSLIQSVSARDVAAEVGFKGMSPTNSEALIKAAPDIIIVMTLGLASVGGVDKALELPGIKQTPAGENRRIIDMSDYEVMSFGPRSAEVIAALGTSIYAPELAHHPDDPPESIDKRLKEINEELDEDN